MYRRPVFPHWREHLRLTSQPSKFSFETSTAFFKSPMVTPLAKATEVAANRLVCDLQYLVHRRPEKRRHHATADVAQAAEAEPRHNLRHEPSESKRAFK